MRRYKILISPILSNFLPFAFVKDEEKKSSYFCALYQ
jgi:hypothetical protein